MVSKDKVQNNTRLEEMTVIQQRKVLERICELEADISALKKARLEIASTGYASATISTSGGSKSYTRLDLDDITKSIYELTRELNQLRMVLATGNSNPLKSIVTVYV